VRFGQGFVFSPPRPVRAEALQGIADNGRPAEAAPSVPPAAPARTQTAASGEAATARRSSGLSQIARRI
jgi:hypothetical protein